MKRTATLCATLCAACLITIGCESGEATSVVDGANQSALDEYEAAIAAEGKMMDDDSSDADETP